MLEKLKRIDDKLSSSVTKIHNPVLNKIMLLMTFLGDQGKIWFLFIAIVSYAKRSLYISTAFFFSLLVAFLSAEVVIKRLVERERPCSKIDKELLLLKKVPQFYSFPSSHSATSFAMATASFMLCGMGFTVTMMVIAVGVALSRFYLQAHYLTDVLCGIVIGILCTVITIRITHAIFFAINPALIK